MRSEFSRWNEASKDDKQQSRLGQRLLAVAALAVIVGVVFAVSMGPSQELADVSAAEMQRPFSLDNGPNSAINLAVPPESAVG